MIYYVIHDVTWAWPIMYIHCISSYMKLWRNVLITMQTYKNPSCDVIQSHDLSCDAIRYEIYRIRCVRHVFGNRV